MLRSMKYCSAALVTIGCLLSWSDDALADQVSEIPGIDLVVIGAVGGGYPDRGGLLVAARLRRIPEVPFAIEANLYVPWGVGANLLIDVYRNERLRVHMFDPGIFYSWEPSLRVTRPDVGRDFDMTFGLGVEWNFAPRWWLTVDSRFFFADLFRAINHYGAFARRVYADSARGVQTWIGIGYSF